MDTRLNPTELALLSDEDLAVKAQTSPLNREGAFDILYARTDKIRKRAAAFAPCVSRGYSREDTISNGAMGLIKAVDSFDPTRKTSFATHARRWIRRYSDNRGYADQPLTDQYNARKPSEGGYSQRAGFVLVPPFGAGPEEGDSTFDGVVGGREDIDRGEVMDLFAALDQLESDQRELVTRKYLRGDSTREIAEDMGVSRHTISNRLTKTFDALRSLLKGYDS